MSDYTAKRRSGGGLLTSQILNRINAATVSEADVLIISYTHNLVAAQLLASSFTTGPDGRIGTNIAQNTANSILVMFNGNVDDQNSIDYTGNSAAFTSPDSEPIT